MDSKTPVSLLSTLDLRRVWRNFKTVSQWTSEPNTCIPCRAKCYACARKWSRTGSAHVHLAMDNGGTQRYICDGCLQQLEQAPGAPGTITAAKPCSRC